MIYKANDMDIKKDYFTAAKAAVDKAVDVEQCIKFRAMLQMATDPVVLNDKVTVNEGLDGRAMFTQKAVNAAKAASNLNNVKSNSGFELVD